MNGFHGLGFWGSGSFGTQALSVRLLWTVRSGVLALFSTFSMWRRGVIAVMSIQPSASNPTAPEQT